MTPEKNVKKTLFFHVLNSSTKTKKRRFFVVFFLIFYVFIFSMCKMITFFQNSQKSYFFTTGENELFLTFWSIIVFFSFFLELNQSNLKILSVKTCSRFIWASYFELNLDYFRRSYIQDGQKNSKKSKK